MSQEMTSASNLIELALKYREHGITVIPIPARSKAAKVKWASFEKEQPTEKTLRRWFRKQQVGMAILLGSNSSRWICRDFDIESSYYAWACEIGPAASQFPTVKTDRGYHVYAQTSTQLELTCKPFDDGELRVSCCYTLLPPSIHPDGSTYNWLGNDLFDHSSCTINGPAELMLDRSFRRPIHPGVARSQSLVDGLTHVRGLTHDAQEAHESDEAHETQETHESEAIGGATGPVSVESLESYLEDKDVQGRIRQAIETTIPIVVSNRNKAIFEFTRTLAAILPRIPNPTPLRPIVDHWHTISKTSGEHESDDTWNDFIYGWERVKHPKGSAMESVIQKTLQEPHPVTIAMGYQESTTIGFIASLMGYLHQHHNDTFFLGTGKLEAIFRERRQVKISRTALFKAINRLITEKVIEKVESGNRQKANSYRFIWHEGIQAKRTAPVDWL